MCIVSNMGDYYYKGTPWIQPWDFGKTPKDRFSELTEDEKDREIKRLKGIIDLILAGKKYDEQFGEPHCETETKMRAIKEAIRITGVDDKGIFDE